MELNKKSWHCWLYRTVYGKYCGLPNNLCGYFWKGIVSGVLLLLTIGVVMLPAYLLSLPFLKKSWWRNGIVDWEEGFSIENIFLSIFMNAIITIAVCMVAVFFKPTFGIITGAALGWMTVIASCIAVYITTRDAKLPEFPKKEKKPNIFKEVIKTWYNRNCPHINWKD